MRPWVLAAAGFCVLGLAAAGVFFLPRFLSLAAPADGQDPTPPGLSHKKPLLAFHATRTSHIRAAGLSGNGLWLTTAGKDDLAHLWDLRLGRQVRLFEGHAAAIRAVALSSDGSRLATGSDDKTARLWDAATGRALNSFAGHEKPVRALALSADGTLLATACDDRTVRLWDQVGNDPKRLIHELDAVHALALSEDARWLATGGKVAQLWDLSTAEPVREFRGLGTRVGTLAISANAQWLATGSDDEVARLLNLTNGKLMRVYFEPQSRPISSVAISGDGKWIASSSGERFVSLFAAVGEDVRTFHLPVTVPIALLSRDGKWLFAVGDDDTTHVLDVVQGKAVCRLVSFRKGNWAVMDAAGRYDSSNHGDIDDMFWIVDNQTLPLHVFKDRFHDPGLLAKLLGHDPSPLRTLDDE